MLSFGAVVAANNLIALQNFNTFLFNLEIHERPGFLERKLITWAKGWIQRKAFKQFQDLKAEIDPNTFGLGLKDCPTPLYAAFFTAIQPQVLKNGKEIFDFLSMSNLEFEKIKREFPMSLLIPNRKGNPKWVKGVAQNPKGRPKGKIYSGIKYTLKKLRRDPVEELIMLADLAKASKNYAMAVGIWKDLHEENSSFPSLEGVEAEGKEAAKKLAELERGEDGDRSGSSSASVGTREIAVQAPSSPKEDLPVDPK